MKASKIIIGQTVYFFDYERNIERASVKEIKAHDMVVLNKQDTELLLHANVLYSSKKQLAINWLNAQGLVPEDLT